MGTRADFYRGLGEDAVWLGSVGMDGDPEAIAELIGVDDAESFTTSEQWQEAVTRVLLAHDEGTHPTWGWPWPWDDSRTTDYAYAWTRHCGVLVSSFGTPWSSLEYALHHGCAGEVGTTVFPDMSAVRNTRWDSGNAPMLISATGLFNEVTESRNRPKPKEG